MNEEQHREWLKDRIPDAEWTRTDWVSTHEYTTIGHDKQLYWALTVFIDRYGFPVEAFGYGWMYATIDGYHYWWTPDCVNRVPTADNDEQDWGHDVVADPEIDHEPDDPKQVTLTSHMLSRMDISPNRQL